MRTQTIIHPARRRHCRACGASAPLGAAACPQCGRPFAAELARAAGTTDTGGGARAGGRRAGEARLRPWTSADPNGARRWGLSFGAGVVLCVVVGAAGAYMTIEAFDDENARGQASETVRRATRAAASDALARHQVAAEPKNALVASLKAQIAAAYAEAAKDADRLRLAATAASPSARSTPSKSPTPSPSTPSKLSGPSTPHRTNEPPRVAPQAREAGPAVMPSPVSPIRSLPPSPSTPPKPSEPSTPRRANPPPLVAPDARGARTAAIPSPISPIRPSPPSTAHRPSKRTAPRLTAHAVSHSSIGDESSAMQPTEPTAPPAAPPANATTHAVEPATKPAAPTDAAAENAKQGSNRPGRSTAGNNARHTQIADAGSRPPAAAAPPPAFAQPSLSARTSTSFNLSDNVRELYRGR